MKGFAFPFSPFFLLYREGHNEDSALLWNTPYHNLTAVPVHDLFANGEAHACSAVRGILAVKPLKRLKNLVTITFIETYAIVLDHNPAGCTRDLSVNLHDGRLRFFPVLY